MDHDPLLEAVMLNDEFRKIQKNLGYEIPKTLLRNMKNFQKYLEKISQSFV